jgi:hypothetical protein
VMESLQRWPRYLSDKVAEWAANRVTNLFK